MFDRVLNVSKKKKKCVKNRCHENNFNSIGKGKKAY